MVYIVMAGVIMVYIAVAHIGMACIVIACKVMAYIAMAYILIACKGMAYIVIARTQAGSVGAPRHRLSNHASLMQLHISVYVPKQTSIRKSASLACVSSLS